MWNGGSLDEWIKSSGDLIVDILKFKPPLSHVETRLSDCSRIIIRGVIQKLRQLHSLGLCHTQIKCENILVSKTLHIQLFDGANKHFDEFHIEADNMGLLGVITDILKDKETPKDVSHLMDLLRRNYDRSTQGVIYHHSCIWTASETVANILLFRLEIHCCPISSCHQIKEAVGYLPEEEERWELEVEQHKLYARALNEWRNKLKKHGGSSGQGAAKILSFMRMAIWHTYEHKIYTKRQQESDGRRTLRNLKAIYSVESDLFTFFPMYIAHFLEETKEFDHITEIYQNKFL